MRHWMGALLAVFLLVPVAAQAQRSGEHYAPVAHAEIRVGGDKLESSLQVLEQFTRDQKAKFKSGDFPKQGRRVANVSIALTPDSFFVADNVMSEDELLLIAYSHDQPYVWMPGWVSVLRALRTRLGRESVTVVSGPSGE